MKLDAKLFGRFRVKKLVYMSGLSVELELPKRWPVHNVFHTSLLEPHRESTKGLHPPPTAITERGIDKRCKPNKSFIDLSGIEHEIGYDVDGQRVYEGAVFDQVGRVSRGV